MRRWWSHALVAVARSENTATSAGAVVENSEVVEAETEIVIEIVIIESEASVIRNVGTPPSDTWTTNDGPATNTMVLNVVEIVIVIVIVIVTGIGIGIDDTVGSMGSRHADCWTAGHVEIFGTIDWVSATEQRSTWKCGDCFSRCHTLTV